MNAVLAEAILVIHFLFVVFAALGGVLVLRWLSLAWVHLPCVAWGVWIELSGNICPLTPWENQFRQAAGQAGYEGGFIEHYLTAVLYPDGLTRELQWTLAALLLVINGAIYAAVIRQHRKSQQEQ